MKKLFFNQKVLLTCIFMTTAMYCSAQKQLLSYQDLQYIIQSNTAAVTGFLQQKDYHLQSADNKQARFFALFADEDYNDFDLSIQGKHATLTLLTTDLQQIETLENSLKNYVYKSTKNGKTYRIKSDAISVISIKPPAEAQKVYTVLVEN
ncbi:MAG: hypothetical protein EOP43_04950 [Sphingobacteriaceae bacterium]|nr:MAG: hypothetical protein EOP43_04950 [Sphingobacteriaceae bacterium]